MIGGLFFLSVLGFALLIMLLSPRTKAGAALFCAICGMLFVSFYGCIIAEWMVPVAYLLMYGGLLCLLAGAAAAALNRRGLRSRLLSPGLLLFAAISLFAFFDAANSVIQGHDSLSFWARSVKELYTFDTFYIHADSTMYHMDYIPLLTSLQYCVVRVFGWMDGYLYYVPAACIAASVALLTDLLSSRKLAVLFGVVLYYAYLSMGFELLGLRSDGAMTAVFAAGLISVFARGEDHPSAFLPALFACAVLVGFKIYSGLMFAALIAAAMLVEWLGLRKAHKPRRAVGVMLLVSAALILCLHFGWSVKYNVSEALADVQKVVDKAAYLGQTVTPAGAQMSLGTLLSGNPRTGQLLQSFTPEKIQQFLGLARGTLTMYASSHLIWLWPFVIACAALIFASSRQDRRPAFKGMLFLLIAGFIYLAGLFGSYFVQAETSGAATNYLITASTPLMMGAFFFVLWLSQGRLRSTGYSLAAAMTAGMLLLTPPTVLLPEQSAEYSRGAGLATEFYAEIQDQLLPEDKGKHAILLECSYEASQIASQSGKTHAYAYWGLPVRVEEPVYFTYGDYTQLENGLDVDFLMDLMKQRCCELLILHIEDELYWDEIAYAFDLYGDYDGPVGVYEVNYEDDLFTFTFRGADEEYEM